MSRVLLYVGGPWDRQSVKPEKIKYPHPKDSLAFRYTGNDGYYRYVWELSSRRYRVYVWWGLSVTAARARILNFYVHADAEL